MIKNLVKKYQINKKGFTLVELLIVIAIIGILVTIVVIAVNPLQLLNNARDARRRSDLNQIKASLQLYYNDCKDYPPSLPFAGTFGSNNPATASTCDDATTYMRQVPGDTPQYIYTRVDASSYRVTTDLNSTTTVTTTRAVDDTNTLTKCGAGNTVLIDFAVCND